jgi:hypothetical protein
MTMTVHHRQRQAARGNSRTDRLEYRLLLAIAFVICFVMVAGSRAYSTLRGRPIDTHGQSIFAEARASAHATAGYAFIA